jgi:hypothetical protein
VRPQRSPAWADRGVDVGLPALLAVLILGPVVFGRGYALHGDMVFVPRQPWKDAWLGLDGTAPRFVPGDAILSLATTVVPGEVVQKAVLFGALLLAGAGAARLVAPYGRAGRTAAVILYLWNPWVLERLSIGQWGSVAGYAALPWLVIAAARARSDLRGGWPGLALWLVFAALWSPPAGLLAVATALAVVAVGRGGSSGRSRGRWRPLLAAAGLGVLANLPWLIPALTATRGLDASGGSFSAFAVRAESGAGVVASVLSLGGIWKSSVVPGERTVAPLVLAACVPTALAVVALWRARGQRPIEDRRTTAGLGGLAIAVIAVCLVPAVPGAARFLDDLAASVPATALLRDGHRFLGAAALVLLPGLALCVDGLWRSVRVGRDGLRAVAVLVVLLPVVCLPSMAWGLGGELRPVAYPREWAQVADQIQADADIRPGVTVVLPWRGTYRGFEWNERRAMLDPAPRFFSGEVWIDDRIYLGDRVLGHEDPRLGAVTEALADTDPSAALAAIGVARVLVHSDNGVEPSEIPPGVLLHQGPGLRLISLAGPDRTQSPASGVSPTVRAAALAGDALTLGCAGLAAACILRRRVYRDPHVAPGRGHA